MNDIVDNNIKKRGLIHEKYFIDKTFSNGYFKKLNQYDRELADIIKFGRLYDQEEKTKSIMNMLIKMYNSRIDLINDELIKKLLSKNNKLKNITLDKMEVLK